ncbi:hypothetical protein Ciccas_014505 [Cichlidogyrus casuarinus]|uniref:Uncharacterized protein n=1 Tax=Cichlidogyrus casuarinus TaxID=1844966 RepID=A0ABD2PMQ5_9PLAT
MCLTCVAVEERYKLDFENAWPWYHQHSVNRLKAYGLPGVFYLESYATWYDLRSRLKKDHGTTTSFDLIENAPYDVPTFLQEGRFVPSHVMGGYCSPGTELNRADFLFFLTTDAYRDSYGELQESWKFGSMYATEWLVPFNFYFLLCMCNIGKDIERTCYDPCYNNPCQSDRHSTKKCQVQFDKEGVMKKKIARKYREYFGRSYNRIHSCSCERGYAWSKVDKKCSKTAKVCDDAHYGDSKSPCRNDGTCVPLPAEEIKEPDITFRYR